MNLHQNAEEMHEGGDERGGQDRCQRHIEIFDHQEGDGAHNGWGDLPSGRGSRFNGGGKMAWIADADHSGNGERSGGHRVGNGRTGNRPQHGRRQHRHFCRSTGIAPGKGGRDIDKQLTQADPRGHDTKQHEMEHISGNDAKGSAIDPLGREIEMVDNIGPARTRMNKNSRHGFAEIGIGNEKNGDHGQRPAHGAAHRFEQHDDHDRSHENVDGQRVANAEGKLAIDPGNIKRTEHPGSGKSPVDERQPERRFPTWRDNPVAERRETEKDHQQCDTQMQAAMNRRLRNAIASSVKVVTGEEKQDYRGDDAQWPAQGSKA